ncbi:MAG: histidinol-phosphate transaminase [Rhodanobacteraceae bacterium]
MTFDAGRLANPAIAALGAYDSGHDLAALRVRFGRVIAELGANENPLGPSPAARAAMRAALTTGFRYPDPRGAALKAALARHLGVTTDHIALGNGSHELLMLLAQCFADPSHSVVFSQHAFVVFAIAAAAVGAPAIVVPALPSTHATAPFGHDPVAIATAVRDDTRLIYLANPNNPTGTWFGDDALDRLIERVPPTALIVVDEAYHEYVDGSGPTSALRLLDRYPNLVVTRTFSKAYGLAGLRIGYVVAHPSVVGVLERLRQSFNVNCVALAAAEASLADASHIEKVRAFNTSERRWLCNQLSTRGFAILPSQTNFVLLDIGSGATGVERHLLEGGVVVRPVGGYGLTQSLRVSIGSRAENRRLLDALP